ncbi:MAG: hypothetical protein Kow0025_09490 [Thermodesulfovibrionales bacterium]
MTIQMIVQAGSGRKGFQRGKGKARGDSRVPCAGLLSGNGQADRPNSPRGFSRRLRRPAP